MIFDLNLIVTPTQDGYRLDRFLRDCCPSIPGRSIRSAIAGGDVSTGGRRSAKGELVHSGQPVLVRRMAEPSDWLPLPGDLPGASILYQDSAVAVLHKPEGVQTEPQDIREKGTLAGYFFWRFPQVPAWNTPPATPLLSRLDRDTSGVVLAALTESAFGSLLIERQTGRIVKKYICKVAGRIPEPVILGWTIESKGGRRVKVRVDSPDPRQIYWTRIVPISSDSGCTIVSAEIIKGKRHQIRAHLAAAGHPILGDTIYGSGGGEGRLMLHASEVTFRHPETGEPMTVTSPVPAEFGA